jgi:Zn-dependent peptidase ImmA (M78 family)/transcriptional regulator with XRE-family HTH domain
MTSIFNRAMFQVARAARGLTQGELASRAALTQAFVSKLENGLIPDPTPETVDALAEALNFPRDFFFSEEKPHGLSHFHYRKRAKLGKRVLEKIEADINIRRMHLGRLLRSYEAPAAKEFPTIDLARNQWTPRQAAQAVRGLWLVPRGPIDNLTALVERAGAIVIQIDFGTTSLDAISIRVPGMPPMIFMNSSVPGDRYRFTLAHECCHLICHSHPENEDELEEQADEFAAELLMPANEIRSYLINPTFGTLSRAKQYWKVSIKALIVQASRLKLITPNQYTRLNVMYSKYGYAKTGEPFPIALEKPSTLSAAVGYHLTSLGYSVDEIAKLLMINSSEFSDTYAERPKLRLVK